MSKHSTPVVSRFLLSSALFFGLGPAAFAQAPGEPPIRHEMRWLRQLDLSDAQRDRIFAIFHEQAPAVHDRREAARRARQELDGLAVSERFDAERARTVAEVEGNAITELALMRAETLRKVREVLTPQQRAKLDTLKKF